MPVTVTTNLPDEDEPILESGIEDEIGIDRETAVSDYGDVRVQIREAGETSWDGSAAGFAEQVITYDTLLAQFTGLEEGVEYEVRLRTETEHVTGQWVTTTHTTDFPTGELAQATATSLTPANVFTISSEARVLVEGPIEKQELRFISASVNPLRHSAISEFEIAVPHDADEVSLLADTFARVRFEYEGEVFFRGIIETSTAGSRFGGADATLRGRGRGRLLWRGSPEQPYAVDNKRVDDALDEYIDTRTTFTPDVERDPGSTIAEDQEAIDADATADFESAFATELADDTIPIVARNGVLEAYDTCYVKPAEEPAQATGSGWKEYPAAEGDSPTSGSGLAHAFTDDYSGSVPSDDSYDQSATWEFDIPYEIPAEHLEFAIRYIGVGAATQFDIVWTIDGTEIGTFASSGNGTDSAFWSESLVETLGADVDSVGPGTVTVTAEPSLPTLPTNHTLTFDSYGSAESIPDDELKQFAEDVTLYNGNEVYLNEDNPDVADGAGDYTIDYANGTITALEQGEIPLGESILIEYEYVPDGLNEFAVDMVGPYDTRWDYDFPDTLIEGTDGGVYLEGPQRKPTAAQIVSDAVDFPNTVENATVTSTWVDGETSSNQAIEFSPDGGTTWLGQSNATDFTQNLVDEDALGTQLQARLTFDRYGERDNGTPLTGFESQAVDVLDVVADLSSIAVIEDQTFDSSNFANLQNIADQGDYRFVVDPASEERIVHAFKTGSSTKEADFDVIDVSHDNDNQGYAAKVTVRGAKKPEEEQTYDGERYERTIENSEEVQRWLDLGLDEADIPHRTFTDPRLGSQAEVDRRAATRLEECVRIRSIKGDLEVVPTIVMPGYRYYVEAFDDELDLESVTFSMGFGEASGTLQFTEEQTLAVDVSELSLGVEQNRQAL